MALSDWYPWCCEGGNINTTAPKYSPNSHADRCSHEPGVTSTATFTQSGSDVLTVNVRHRVAALIRHRKPERRERGEIDADRQTERENTENSMAARG